MSASASAPASHLRAIAGAALLHVAPPLLFVGFIVAIWEAAKRLSLLPITVPAPSEITVAFGRAYGDLFYHAQPTALSALMGFGLAAAIAFSLGAVALRAPRTEAAILKAGVLIDSVPLIALTPILMVWVGNGLTARIVIGTIAALLPLLVGVIQGFKAIDRSTEELFHVLAASPSQRLWKLALPSALPFIFSAFRVAAPLAVLGALIAEWVSADRGLGIMMTYAIFSFDVPLAWLTILAVSLMATFAYGLVALVERLVVGPRSAMHGEVGADHG